MAQACIFMEAGGGDVEWLLEGDVSLSCSTGRRAPDIISSLLHQRDAPSAANTLMSVLTDSGSYTEK